MEASIGRPTATSLANESSSRLRWVAASGHNGLQVICLSGTLSFLHILFYCMQVNTLVISLGAACRQKI